MQSPDKNLISIIYVNNCEYQKLLTAQINTDITEITEYDIRNNNKLCFNITLSYVKSKYLPEIYFGTRTFVGLKILKSNVSSLINKEIKFAISNNHNSSYSAEVDIGNSQHGPIYIYVVSTYSGDEEFIELTDYINWNTRPSLFGSPLIFGSDLSALGANRLSSIMFDRLTLDSLSCIPNNLPASPLFPNLPEYNIDNSDISCDFNDNYKINSLLFNRTFVSPTGEISADCPEIYGKIGVGYYFEKDNYSELSSLSSQINNNNNNIGWFNGINSPADFNRKLLTSVGSGKSDYIFDLRQTKSSEENSLTINNLKMDVFAENLIPDSSGNLPNTSSNNITKYAEKYQDKNIPNLTYTFNHILFDNLAAEYDKLKLHIKLNKINYYVEKADYQNFNLAATQNVTKIGNTILNANLYSINQLSAISTVQITNPENNFLGGYNISAPANNNTQKNFHLSYSISNADDANLEISSLNNIRFDTTGTANLYLNRIKKLDLNIYNNVDNTCLTKVIDIVQTGTTNVRDYIENNCLSDYKDIYIFDSISILSVADKLPNDMSTGSVPTSIKTTDTFNTITNWFNLRATLNIKVNMYPLSKTYTIDSKFLIGIRSKVSNPRPYHSTFHYECLDTSTKSYPKFVPFNPSSANQNVITYGNRGGYYSIIDPSTGNPIPSNYCDITDRRYETAYGIWPLATNYPQKLVNMVVNKDDAAILKKITKPTKAKVTIDFTTYERDGNSSVYVDRREYNGAGGGEGIQVVFVTNGTRYTSQFYQLSERVRQAKMPIHTIRNTNKVISNVYIDANTVVGAIFKLSLGPGRGGNGGSGAGSYSEPQKGSEADRGIQFHSIKIEFGI